MINAVRRCINLFVIVAFVLGAVSFHSVHEVRAQGFTTPPQINGIFNPDTIYPSQTTRLTINVFNPNVSQLTEVHWMNHLPDDLIVVDPPNPLVTGCGGSYLLDATPGNDYISISAATTDGTTDPVNPGVCSVTVSVTSFDPGNHTNVIDRDTDGGYLLNGVSGLYEYDANITLLVLDMSAPDVDKSFSPDLINEGENSQLTITIQNTDSTVALTQVSLTDNFPAGLSVSDTSVSLSNCGSGTLNPIAIDDTSIHLSNATIATGATCTIRVNVKTSGTGTFTNVIHPADLTNYQQVTIPSNVSDDLVVENLELDKSFSPDNFQVGTGYSTLSISITNPDAINPLTNVHFTDTMDPDVTVVPGFSSVSGTGCSGDIVDTNPASLSVNNGVIPAGGTCVFSARVESNVVGSHPNTISCSDITFDGGTAGCQSASDTLNVYDTGLGLGVVKSFSSSNVAPGQDNGMTIEITAPGDTDLTNFSLTDNFPAGVLLYRPEPSHEPNFSQSGCGAGTFAALPSDMGFTFSGGTILAGTTCRLQVNVVSSVYGPHTNTIHPGDIDNSENRNISGDVSATFTVRDISITKSFASSIVGRNGITTLTLNVINNYSVPVTNINFTDTLPGTVDNGIIIATPSNLSTTCTGSVTTGAQSITLTDGELAASQRCTITVDVQGTSTSAPPPGTTYTNRIEIGGVTGRVNGTTLTQNWHAASAGITVGSPDFRINKKFDPILVTGDTASTMTITLVNTESSPVSEIAFTDTLPTHMLLAVPPNPTTGMCGGTITPAADRMSFTYSGGSLLVELNAS